MEYKLWFFKFCGLWLPPAKGRSGTPVVETKSWYKKKTLVENAHNRNKESSQGREDDCARVCAAPLYCLHGYLKIPGGLRRNRLPRHANKQAIRVTPAMRLVTRHYSELKRRWYVDTTSQLHLFCFNLKKVQFILK